MSQARPQHQHPHAEGEPGPQVGGDARRTPPTTRRGDDPGRRRRTLRRLTPSLIVAWALPVGLYALLRGPLGDVAALAIGMAAPSARALFVLVARRRVDLPAMLALAGFATGLLISLASGGSTLALELHGELWTTLLGLACVGSVLVGRPLLMILASRWRRNRPQDAAALEGHGSDQARASLWTFIIGLVFLASAAAHVILAIELPTGRYLVLARVATWASLAIVLLLVRSFARRPLPHGS